MQSVVDASERRVCLSGVLTLERVEGEHLIEPLLHAPLRGHRLKKIGGDKHVRCGAYCREWHAGPFRHIEQ
jgi:hypothetical protein